MSEVSLGVVGAGHMGCHHARRVASIAAGGGGLRLVAVADIDSAKAQKLGQETGSRALDDFRDLLGLVDAVVVAVPTVAHYSVVEASLAAGVDVLVEKPIAATLPEANKLVAQAADLGRILVVGHLEWFNAAMRRASAVIQQPRFIEAHRMGPFPGRSTDVDVVRDLMIHDLDIIQRLVGEEPDRTEAIGVPVVSDRVDIANARLGFPGGCVANLTASRVSPTPMRKIRLFQADAYVSIDFLEQGVTIARRGARKPTGEREIEFERLTIDRGDALEAQLLAFRNAVLTRKVDAGAANQGLSALRTALRVIDAMPRFEPPE